jgi:hypothetical protein
VRALLLFASIWSTAVVAKPVIIDIKTVPSTPRAALAMLAKEKPGPFRRQLVAAIEARVREKGTPVTDVSAIDEMTLATFGKIFEELAAPTDVWDWSGQEGAPHGEVLSRKTVKVRPGTTSSALSKAFTVTPKGKRMDRGFSDMAMTVEVSVAKSDQDFFVEVEQRKHWVAVVLPVVAFDNVARVAVQFLSPGTSESPAAHHERPLWVAFFKLDHDRQFAHLEPYTALEQRLQESNVLPFDPKEKLTEAQKQLVLTMRMDDLKAINPARGTLSPAELKLVSLEGLTESPVDPKHVAWLEPWRTDENPLARGVALLRIAQLGGKVSAPELASVVEQVRAGAVQTEALAALGRLLDGSTEMLSETDKAQLTKNSTDAIKSLAGIAKLNASGKVSFFKQSAGGWAPLRAAK